jgi:hypothetical protein
MKIPTLIAILVAGFSGAAFCQDRLVSGFPDLPPDAQAVAERSIACQHFWGEVNGTGDQRDKQVAEALQELKCDRVTQDLDLIRVKYGKDQRVLAVLKEAAIE